MRIPTFVAGALCALAACQPALAGPPEAPAAGAALPWAITVELSVGGKKITDAEFIYPDRAACERYAQLLRQMHGLPEAPRCHLAARDGDP